MISGIGPIHREKFARLGVKTIRDLLYHFPSRYDDYSALKTIDQLFYGDKSRSLGGWRGSRKLQDQKQLMMVKAVIEDSSGHDRVLAGLPTNALSTA